MPTPDNATLKDLVPTGRLRAAINLGNSVLAQQDAAGTLGDDTVDLSSELAILLGVDVASFGDAMAATPGRWPKHKTVNGSISSGRKGIG